LWLRSTRSLHVVLVPRASRWRLALPDWQPAPPQPPSRLAAPRRYAVVSRSARLRHPPAADLL
jgi:hypothetical protein